MINIITIAIAITITIIVTVVITVTVTVTTYVGLRACDLILFDTYRMNKL